MGYLLLDDPNPNGDHFYPTRNRKLLAIVMHITAGLEDLDGVDDHSAENTAQYCRTTSTEVSWHSGSDTDTWVTLLPATYTAWHASAYNSPTYGHEISKKHTDWRTMSDRWVASTLFVAAAGLKSVAQAYGIPLRKATRAELDREIAKGAAGTPVGFISHSEVQPADRTDPGWVNGVDTFPWARFFALMTEEDDMQLTDRMKNAFGTLPTLEQVFSAIDLNTVEGRKSAEAAAANSGKLVGLAEQQLAATKAQTDALNRLAGVVADLNLKGQTQEQFDAAFKQSPLTQDLLREGHDYRITDDPATPTSGGL
jgi:hypothetical protein